MPSLPKRRIAQKDIQDLRGMTVRKGTGLYVMKEGPLHPVLKHKVLVVRVDNGTGILDLMPETALRVSEGDVK